jgi:hypothetical protein
MGPGVVISPGDEWEVTPGDLKSGHWTAVGKEAKQVEAEHLKAVEDQAEQVVTDPEPPGPADEPGAS